MSFGATPLGAAILRMIRPGPHQLPPERKYLPAGAGMSTDDLAPPAEDLPTQTLPGRQLGLAELAEIAESCYRADGPAQGVVRDVPPPPSADRLPGVVEQLQRVVPLAPQGEALADGMVDQLIAYSQRRGA